MHRAAGQSRERGWFHQAPPPQPAHALTRKIMLICCCRAFADSGMGMESKHSRGGQIPCCSIGCTIACHTESKNRPVRLLAAPPGGRGEDRRQQAAQEHERGTRHRTHNKKKRGQRMSLLMLPVAAACTQWAARRYAEPSAKVAEATM